MKFIHKIKENKVIKFILSTYVLISVFFIIWMTFFDANSFINQRKYNKEIEELKTSIEFYEKEIEQNKKMIEALKDSKKLEKFAREKYQMKKEEETLFIIEFDTLKK